MKYLSTMLIVFFCCSVLFSTNLKKLSLDDASTIGLKIETDATVKSEGRGSVRITTLWPTTVCLGEASGLAVENAKLIFTARVRTRIQGDVLLEMWVHIGSGQYFSRGLNDRASGQSDWKAIQTPFILQKGQKADKVTFNLVINGTGVVWIDDISLSKEPLPTQATKGS